MSMRQPLLFSFSLALGIALFVWVLRIVGWDQFRVALRTFSGPDGLIILALSVAMLLLGVWRWRRILSWAGYPIEFKSLWPADFAYFAINFLAPQTLIGGEAFQGYFLNKKYNVPIEKAAASAVIERILELTWSALVIVAGTIYFIFTFGLPPKQLAILFGGIFVFFGALLVFFYMRSFRKESIARIFIKRTHRKNHVMEIEGEVFKFFGLKNKQLWQGLGITALRGFVALARTWLVIVFLGKSVNVLPVLSVLGASYLAMLFPIPAALGSHDALQAFTFGAMGMDKASGAVFAMIVRGADLLVALIGIIILFKISLELFRLALLDKAKRVFGKGEN